jgi:hypothetical protein
MGLLKRWMTEILLDVTDSEMKDVAKETIQYEKGNLLGLFLINVNIWLVKKKTYVLLRNKK